MFKFHRGFAISSSGDSKLVSNSSVYERDKVASLASRNQAITSAAMSLGGGEPNNGKMGIGQNITSKNTNIMLLDGILTNDAHIRRRIFKDIYYHDAVAGQAVDVLSEIPFSDFHLDGIRDKSILRVYDECCESIKPSELLPTWSKDFLVMGSALGTANWNAKKRIFDSIIPHNMEHVSTIEVPVYGATPLFNLAINSELSTLFSEQTDPRVKKIIDRLPPYYRDSILRGSIQLEPSNTIFMARKTLSSDIMGTSLYERLLPVHLMEKALFRGSIDAANRRQRATTHIQMGGVDDWLPTPEDMDATRDLFLQADMDPTGAVIVTRTGVIVNEIRNAQDFWKVEDIDGWTSSYKYRALGVSEDIISGTASLSTLDASLSLMLDRIKHHRIRTENAIFYRKLFPAMAAANGFYKRGYQVTGSNEYILRKKFGIHANEKFSLDIDDSVIDLNQFEIPNIVWHKSLSPEGDTAYIELLSTLQQNGVPIPIAIMAAAAGINLDMILDSYDADLENHKRIAAYQEKLQEIMPQLPQDEQQAQQQVQAVLARLANPSNYSSRKKDYWDLNPDFHGPHNTYADGKFRTGTTQERNRRKEQLIKRAAEAIAKIKERENSEIKAARPTNTGFMDMAFGRE